MTNFVQIRGDLIPIAGTINMRVNDPLGALLVTVTAADAVGTTLTYNGANVHRVEITGTSATAAFDDLQFGAVRAIDGVTVPEPSSLAFLAGGALLLGAARQRRRRTLCKSSKEWANTAPLQTSRRFAAVRTKSAIAAEGHHGAHLMLLNGVLP